ncbi:hypothetical protein [Candidatus Contubernalis alkaliaceticus]|uniref:hypothetical protein n=1 Tax=Candidatus Contubernalis alkaliaceticus TaxID=338645 RepID=UPI001F4C1F82|nr:hypothetical protein [Candidatus Contubernalis alkalaceticus]UNC91770.1 hypothetical protein HUE98_06490 [Candidatus Contubernalis alkalaceticus]
MIVDNMMNANLLQVADTNKSSDSTSEDKELKKVSQEFAAILYEKMLSSISKAVLTEKCPEEDMWWEHMLWQISTEAAKSPASPLAVEIYNQLKK